MDPNNIIKNENQITGSMSDIKYSIIFSRRRSISIILSPDKGVIIRAPYRTSISTIQKYIREKSSWIEKHIRNFASLRRINTLQYSDGDILLLQGRELTLKVIVSDRSTVRLYDNYLEAGVSKPEDSREIKIILERWYRQKAYEVFSGRLTHILKTCSSYGFKPSGFTVRTLMSRWGSCNSKGRITLNTHLVKLSEPYVDYVIIHELCHLKHHNHGKEFYRLLEEIIPDYRVIRKRLREYLTS